MAGNLSYAAAGVDINQSDAAKERMASVIDRGDPRVLNRFGAFASLLRGSFPGCERPVLVMKTEEPGSKQRLASSVGRLPLVGYDLIHHLINDIIVMGAEPLYVQDCIVCGRLEGEVVNPLVAAMADACRQQGCVLCGGETSIQPGVIPDGAYVLTASIVGVVDEKAIIDGSRIAEGDVVLAVASNGLHTNGYTLVRKLLELDPVLAQTRVEGQSFLDVILRPHTCYDRALRDLFADPNLKGLAHITGGGIQDNLDRVLPPNLDAQVDLSLIRIPEIFRVIRQAGNVAQSDMLRTFNMGVGLAAVCAPGAAERFCAHLTAAGHAAYAIGRIVRGSKTVRFSGQLNW